MLWLENCAMDINHSVGSGNSPKKREGPWVSQVVLVLKNPPANAGDTGDMDSIPESARSLEKGMATHSSILAWRTP